MDEVRDTVGYGRGWHRRYTEAPNELWEERCTLTPGQVVVYMYLLSCVNEKRNGCTAWPSYETMGKKDAPREKYSNEGNKSLRR